jgi:hypothetical protein
MAENETPVTGLEALDGLGERIQLLDDDDLAWFKEKFQLSREDLCRMFVTANKIVQELHPTDEILDLTYSPDVGNWYINFHRPDTNGRWRVCIRRTDQPAK